MHTHAHTRNHVLAHKLYPPPTTFLHLSLTYITSHYATCSRRKKEERANHLLNGDEAFCLWFYLVQIAVG